MVRSSCVTVAPEPPCFKSGPWSADVSWVSDVDRTPDAASTSWTPGPLPPGAELAEPGDVPDTFGAPCGAPDPVVPDEPGPPEADPAAGADSGVLVRDAGADPAQKAHLAALESLGLSGVVDTRLPGEEDVSGALLGGNDTGRDGFSWSGLLVGVVVLLAATFGPVYMLTSDGLVWPLSFVAGATLTVIGGPKVIRSASSTGAVRVGSLTVLAVGVLVVLVCIVTLLVGARDAYAAPVSGTPTQVVAYSA
jgi:hypothetical protein